MKLWLVNFCAVVFLFLCSTKQGVTQTIIPPDISFVTINPYTNEVSVAWYKSPSENILFTRIHYIYDETGLIKAKTIQDIPGNENDTLFFKTDSIAIFPIEAQDAPLSFAVDAYATNGDNSTSLREFHTTMNAKISIEKCPSQLTLTWTPYIGYNVTIDSYVIIEVDETNNEHTLYSLQSTKKNQIISLNSHDERRFFVEAHFTDIKGIKQISRSNMVYIKTPVYSYPSYIKPQSIHITDMNDVLIDFDIDTTTSFASYAIQLSTNGSTYKTIHTISLQKNELSPYRFTHFQAFNADTTKIYRMIAYNNCNEVILTSPPVSLFTAQAIEASDTKHVISWNMPPIWDQGVSEFTIYRINNNKTEPIAVTSQANTYIDDIGTDYTIGSQVCYRIEATQKTTNFAHTATTNKTCVNKTYRLLLPNAIRPNSSIEENKMFKPTFAFITGDYTLQIFDRFGNCIFESNDIENGWDGTYKNKFVYPGSYNYKIRIKLAQGQIIERTGNIAVIFD